MVIYLDNAATSWPKPEPVLRVLCDFLRDAGANPGRGSHRMAVAASQAVAETRSRIARFINSDNPERIVFCSSATDALNLAIRGWVRPGDRVVTTTVEHNSVRRPLRRCEELGAEIVRVRPPATGVIDPSQIEAAAGGARLIAVCHASNVNGAIQPIADLATVARKEGALLLVDAAQSIGIMPVDVQALGIDLMAFPGHKGLLGPPGTGGLYIGPRVPLDDLEPLRTGGTGIDSESDQQPMTLPFRHEAGTLNTVGIAALGAGVAHVAACGIDQIWAHHCKLTHRLIDGLSTIPRVRVYGAGQADVAPVVSFSVDGWPPAEIGAVLDQAYGIACRTGLHCAPDACQTIGAPHLGTVRFSPGHATTHDAINAAIQAIRDLAAEPLEGSRPHG
jgi:cysteine desulfurase family protein